jgi:predicted HTH domain antitoxin
MRSVGIRDLKDNPSRAMRAAREQPILITNRDDPEALLLSLRGLAEHEPDVRLTLATALFDQADMSLGRAARLAGVSVEAFIAHLGSRGIPILRQSRDDLAEDLRVLDE